jgi:uncharacterized protein (TIGR03083 family)
MMSDNEKKEILEKLVQTRRALLAFLGGLDEAKWETAVQIEDASWTIADVVRHLVNAEQGMTGLIEQFKAGKDPVPPDFDRERYNKSRVRKTQDLTPSDLLNKMETNREHLLTVLETLQPEDWAKKGRHASLRIMTIEEVSHTIADHEAGHLTEMKQVLANR